MTSPNELIKVIQRIERITHSNDIGDNIIDEIRDVCLSTLEADDADFKNGG